MIYTLLLLAIWPFTSSKPPLCNNPSVECHMLALKQDASGLIKPETSGWFIGVKAPIGAVWREGKKLGAGDWEMSSPNTIHVKITKMDFRPEVLVMQHK